MRRKSFKLNIRMQKKQERWNENTGKKQRLTRSGTISTGDAQRP